MVSAKEIEQKLLVQKREQWSFDFVNGEPIEGGLWQWNIIITDATD